ncbi:putative RING zinc finger domain superfamily protein isoform X4 [Zea mays]|uniref:putative RING zinc finger domain superfamily protein isoform X4 n=1 Tax=Zea mays TaxID=4577 RepID=UPI0004DEBE6A|nr:putative RING zinc finger domain superfamily protein isoform X4 [Zea mays]
MGGCCCCCCSARASDSDRAPHRQNPEEHAPLSSAFDGPSPTSAIVAVDTNLDTPSLDTYRAPPAPLPYDVCFTVSENPDVEKSGIKIKTDGQQSPKVDEFESCEKGAPEDKADEEEDVCPICLEEDFTYKALPALPHQNTTKKIHVRSPSASIISISVAYSNGWRGARHAQSVTR